MARKQTVDAIVKLFQKLGGNLNDVLGTRSNISFLGKGKSPELMFEMDINTDALSILPQSKAVEELTSSVGYAVGNKLNDIQANKLLSNMQKMDSIYNPPAAPANVTDLATRTPDLDKAGLMSLRQKPFLDKASEIANKDSEAMIKAGLDPSNPNDAIKAMDLGIVSSGDDIVKQLDDVRKYKPGDPITSENFAASGFAPSDEVLENLRKARESETFGKKLSDSMSDAEIEIRGRFPTASDAEIKKMLDKPSKEIMEILDAQGIDLPTGAGLEAIKNVKGSNLIIDDIVDKIYLNAGVTPAAKPVARANAREFLNRVKDLEDPDFPTGTTLSSIMEADDFKFMTEGGGAGMGDPLLLVQKYFGPKVATAVTKLDGPNEIQKFAENLVKIKDARGNTITNRFFDPETVDPEDFEFADGGRVGLQEGGGIEQRLEQLGGDVTSAEQMLQGINQRLKTAESSLGSGGGGLGSLQQPAVNAAPFMGRPIQLPGIRPNFSATIDPNFKPVEELKAVQPGDPNYKAPGPTILNEIGGLAGETFNQIPEQFRSGFAEYMKDKPMKFGGQAISYVGLPGGNRVMFGDTGSAASFRDYLTSTGFTPPSGLGQLASQGSLGIPAAGYADGGITNLQEPRQGYFLGKIVKKAKKAVKKVVKSPVGKAAILGALTFGIPGTQFGGLAGGKGLAGLKAKLFGGALPPSMGFSSPGILGKLGLTKGGGSLGLTGLGKIAGITGLSGLAGLAAAQEAEDEEGIDISDIDRGEGLNILDIVARARKNDPEFRFLPPVQFQNLAEGGGVGSLAMNEENVPQMYVSDEAGALPKKMKDGEAGVLPSDMGKLKKSDFETEEDYKRYLRQLNRTKRAEGGLMNLGGMEMDLRGGGFVPLGAKEKADDVPARLSKNEFVMTADAVRAAGGGSIDKGADKMYNLMKDLESRV